MAYREKSKREGKTFIKQRKLRIFAPTKTQKHEKGKKW
jgi:hypothetical protein